MIEDLGRFSSELKKAVQANFLRRTEENKPRILEISDAYKTPCVVILYWCGEISGWPDYLKNSLDVIMKFYGYTEIRNKPEGCPW